jgi:hypothetical protein
MTTFMTWLRANLLAILIGFPFIFGSVFWVVSGGAAPWFKSQSALADPDVAEALRTLPEMQNSVESNQDAILQQLSLLSADLSTLRASSEAVMDWDTYRSLEMNAGLECYAGSECRVWYRARRTESGLNCQVFDTTPYLLRGARDTVGRPVTYGPSFAQFNLTRTFKDFRVDFIIPDNFPAGDVRFVTVVIYTSCPFAAEGEVVDRETISIPLSILDEPSQEKNP